MDDLGDVAQVEDVVALSGCGQQGLARVVKDVDGRGDDGRREAHLLLAEGALVRVRVSVRVTVTVTVTVRVRVRVRVRGRV